MANTVVQTAASGVALQDARLFREACYIDGGWLSYLFLPYWALLSQPVFLSPAPARFARAGFGVAVRLELQR